MIYKGTIIMAVSATNSYTGKGIAESFEDIIFDISPEDTPLLSMAKRINSRSNLPPMANRRISSSSY
jgi:hypothetical protein